MSLIDQIPLPNVNKDIFKDVMDYMETIKQRRGNEIAKQNELMQLAPLRSAQAKNELAQAKRNEELAGLPFGGREMPGAAGQALAVEMIKRKYGENSVEYREAKSLYDLDKQKTLQTMEYQKSLMNTQGKRYATNEGKLAQEEAEINQGIMPGTTVGGKEGVPLSPEQKKRLSGFYKLKQLKDVTDTGVRQRILYSKNMEKTLDNLNVDNLVTYSGLKGTRDLAHDTFASAKGQEIPRYEAYKESLTAAKTLAKQVRQFYGDSITAGVQEGLQKLTDPTSWLENPKVAKARFNRFKHILQTEAKTFTDAAKNADIYEESPQPVSGSDNVPTYNFATGEYE